MSIALKESDRAEWLAWRRSGIGASDMPAILGIDPYRSALDVYADKIGEKADEPESLPCRVGLFLEPLIERLYQEQTGRTIVETQVTVADDEFPFIRATLDGVTECGRIVEFKMTHSYAKGLELGEEGTDAIPLPWLAQVMHQMIASGKRTADVAVLRGNSKFSVHTVEHDDGLANLILDKAVDFWARVIDRDPPPATRGTDVRVLAKLYPEPEGETTLDGAKAADVLAWEAAKALASQHSAEADMLKARILSTLGPYQIGHLPDGRVLKRSVIQIAERTQVVRASTQTRLTIGKGASE